MAITDQQIDSVLDAIHGGAFPDRKSMTGAQVRQREREIVRNTFGEDNLLALSPLERLKGRTIECVTHEGSVIFGMLTNIIYKDTHVLGEMIKTVTRLEFNGDASEFCDWDLVETLTLRRNQV